jgi:hypothetical protein
MRPTNNHHKKTKRFKFLQTTRRQQHWPVEALKYTLALFGDQAKKGSSGFEN